MQLRIINQSFYFEKHQANVINTSINENYYDKYYSDDNNT